jgi:hypothetical protein
MNKYVVQIKIYIKNTHEKVMLISIKNILANKK